MLAITRQQPLHTAGTVEMASAQPSMTLERRLVYLGVPHPRMRGVKLALQRHGSKGRLLERMA